MKDDDTNTDGGTATATPEPARPPAESLLARAQRIVAGDIRPDDYLKPTAEVIALVDRYIANGDVDEGGRQWLTDVCNLQVHFPGREVACWRTGHGVVVFAVGDEDVRKFLAWFTRVPEEQRPDVIIEYP